MSHICNRCNKTEEDEECRTCGRPVQVAYSVKGKCVDLLHRFVKGDPVLRDLRYEVEYWDGYTEIRVWIRLKDGDDALSAYGDPYVADIAGRLCGKRLEEFVECIKQDR